MFYQKLERLFVVAAANVYQESHFWTRMRTEGQELFTFPKIAFESNIAMHDLICWSYILITLADWSGYTVTANSPT